MTTQPTDNTIIGQTLGGQYEILREVAKGGMGVVYEAVHTRLSKKRLAVKLLHPGIVENPQVFARFRREAEIATELHHLHIVDVIDFNETEHGQPYMVMEFLEGENLLERIQDRQALGLEEVCLITSQVASALAAAHSHGIVHRDIKPENIYLTRAPGGEILVKVVDFGISKIRHSKSVVTQDQSVMGTPFYMSPEQALGNVNDIDHRTDIFALGTICFQAITGRVPFDAPTIPGVIYKICHEPAPRLGDLSPEIPEGVSAVIERALAKDKGDRYNEVEQFSRDLEAACKGAAPASLGSFTLEPATASDQADGDEPAEFAMAETMASDTQDLEAPSDTPVHPGLARTTLSGATGEQDATRMAVAAITSRTRGLWLIGLAALVVAVAGAAIYLGREAPREAVTKLVHARTTPANPGAGGGGQQRPANEPTPAAPPPAPAALPPAPDNAIQAVPQVTITVQIDPPDATWKLDGEPGRETSLRLARGKEQHVISAEAVGHLQGEVRFMSDGDRTVSLHLKRAPKKRSKPGPRRPTRRNPPVAGAAAREKAVPSKKPKAVGEGVLDWAE